jgi:hypothetical protein
MNPNPLVSLKNFTVPCIVLKIKIKKIHITNGITH